MNIHETMPITAPARPVLLPIRATAQVPLRLAAAVLLLPVLGGCALETPKAYIQIPHTDYSAYVYLGGGIAETSDTTGK